MAIEDEKYEFSITGPLDIYEVRDGKPYVERAHQAITSVLFEHEQDTLEEQVNIVAKVIRSNVNIFAVLSPYEALSTIVGGDPESVLQDDQLKRHLAKLQTAFEEEFLQ